jgi:A/G-specific adenine glycosylase
VAESRSDFGWNQARIADFVAAVRDHHRAHRRDLPWRRTHDPYEILVSEMMLQQTQVARVLEKYPQFLAAFPTVAVLAAAPTAEVLAVWQGLGYNRRALALHRAAGMIVSEYGGRVPDRVDDLRRLPGVGPATAAALSAFAFGQAEAFIETNIRAAFIHFFFENEEDVPDAAILPLVEQTMDRDDPREWFYALMDYGVWVKRTFANPSRRSKHHAVQSPFAGSRREVRANVLQALLALAPAAADLPAIRRMAAPDREPAEVESVLGDLVREGFLERDGDGEGGGYRVSASGPQASTRATSGGAASGAASHRSSAS